MALDPIVSRRLYQQVAERIKQQIQAGSISAGDRLPAEKDLALQLGVSRPMVREALIALEIAGLVEIRTGSGTYIRDRGKLLFPMVDAGPGPFELLHARLLIEGEVAAEAAIRATDRRTWRRSRRRSMRWNRSWQPERMPVRQIRPFTY